MAPQDYLPYDDELERTIFVNGLAYESTEADIRYFFEECGEIERINLPRYQHSDRNVGYCHVRFSRRRYARRGLELTGKYLDKRYLKIEMAQDMRPKPGYQEDKFRDTRDKDRRERSSERVKEPRDSFRTRENDRERGFGRGSVRRQEEQTNSKTIFVKNLPYETNEDEVGDFFEDCGEVKTVRLIFNSGHSHFKGFGYVDFHDSNSARKALKLNGTDFGGRSIFIDMELEKPKRGFGQDWDSRNENGFRRDSGSGSRSRRKLRSRSRSKDKFYRHTTGKGSLERVSNDGEFGKSNHYYNKMYNDKQKLVEEKESVSRTSSSRSSRSNYSKNSQESYGKINLDLQMTGNVFNPEKSDSDFNIAGSIDPRLSKLDSQHVQ